MSKAEPRLHGRRQALRPAPTGWGKLRQSRNISLRELEELTGISRGTLSRIEQSTFPSPRDAARLARFYGLTDEPDTQDKQE